MRHLVLFFVAALSALSQEVSVRIVFGLGDGEGVRWDGRVEASGAEVQSLEPWRFESPDAIDGASWTASIHLIRRFGGAAAAPPAPVANGVVARLNRAAESATLRLTTAQGNFSVRLADIPYGKMVRALDNRVMIDRVPPAAAVTTSGDEQDYPAAAASRNGDIWLAWMEFKHHPEHNQIRANLREAPANFDRWKTRPPGDQIFAARFTGGKWQEPVAITPPGGDLYRPAVAVDGRGRAWVFWSANDNGNFELWGRPVDGAQAGAPVRLSTAPGSDVFPAAAADSAGRVWVTWQAWRDGRAQILAAQQNADAFAPHVVISSSSGNEWNPAIAASAGGRVSIAYESYRAGNYDVFVRTLTSGKWGPETAVASSARYEAYPSLAYEPGGRLWVAYEEGAEAWGKDFGADESSGVALYQGRAIRLTGIEPDGRRVIPAADPGTVLPGTSDQRVDSVRRQATEPPQFSPEAGRWKRRDPNRATYNYPGPRNTTPRLHVDASGRLWLAVRSNHPFWWNPVGTTWHEWVASYDGESWTGPIFLTHSDNLLDNRPALVSTVPGELRVLGSTDHRAAFHRIRNAAMATWVDDPYNNDIFSNLVQLAPGSGKNQVRPAPSLAPAALSADEKIERAQIEAMRKARVNGAYHVVRGEFHRHSEISADGGNDGALLEQWRYMLDAADMDWAGCCDHDNGGGREYTWWINQKLTDIFYTPGRFVPMFSYERSVPYPEGHRNVVFAQRGIRPLPRLPITRAEPVQRAPDTEMLYRYLKQFNGIAAVHTSGTNMGTDWRDNDPGAEPVVEIYQGDRQNYEMPGAPRGNSEQDSIGGWRPKGFVNLALEMGYKLAFQASSDHISTHMSYCNILSASLTREGLLDGLRKRHVYGATDNILAEFRSGKYIMGDSFTTAAPPEFQIKLTGTAPFAKVHIVRNNQYVYTAQPNQRTVHLTWRDASPVAGKTSYYYVRGEQADGEVVWVSPMWIDYTGR
jgi:hypothetical protein